MTSLLRHNVHELYRCLIWYVAKTDLNKAVGTWISLCHLKRNEEFKDTLYGNDIGLTVFVDVDVARRSKCDYFFFLASGTFDEAWVKSIILWTSINIWQSFQVRPRDRKGQSIFFLKKEQFLETCLTWQVNLRCFKHNDDNDLQRRLSMIFCYFLTNTNFIPRRYGYIACRVA